MNRVTRTRRLKLASEKLELARQAEVAARKSGDQAAWQQALRDIETAENERDAAILDAQAREKVGEGGRRRERALSLEQEQSRASLFEGIGLPAKYSRTSASKQFRISTVDVEPWAMRAIEGWREHCNALGNATVVRWLAMASLVRIGPPPNWEGEWPPDINDDTGDTESNDKKSQ